MCLFNSSHWNVFWAILFPSILQKLLKLGFGRAVAQQAVF